MANEPFEIVLNNVKLYWAFIQEGRFDKGNPTYGIRPRYKVDITLEEGDNLKKANDAGLSVKSPTEGTPFSHVQATSDLDHTPRIVDTKRNKLPKEIMIGNGTVANVKLWCLPYSMGKNKGVAAKISGVQIVKLVEYKSDREDFEEIKDGYVAPNTGNDELNDQSPF